MTDNEIQQLAHQYAEQNPPQTEDEVLKQRGIELNAKMVFEPFLHWLNKTHCIVSRDKVVAEYNDDKAAYNRNKGDLDYFEGYWEGRVDTYEGIFGTKLFEERSEK